LRRQTELIRDPSDGFGNLDLAGRRAEKDGAHEGLVVGDHVCSE
jgi:hypothetical protein